MRGVRIRLGDMAEAIQGIEDIVAQIGFEDFNSSWTMQRAIERGLEIISEASRSLDPESKAMFPDVAWPQIAGIGNILRHEYHRVEPLVIWNITRVHLPVLKLAITAMLRGNPSTEN